MKELESLTGEEIKKTTLRDYFIWLQVSKLEQRVKRIEKGSEFIYKSVSLEFSKRFPPEEEYKKIWLFPISEEDWEFKKWKEELEFFNSIKRELLEDKTYRNKFVAIKDKKLIDSDIDNLRLVKRVNEKYRNEVVLIVKVEIGSPVAEIPSPEVSL